MSYTTSANFGSPRRLLSCVKPIPATVTLAEAQVTLSAAKLGAKVGGVHERVRPGGICLCIHLCFCVNRGETR